MRGGVGEGVGRRLRWYEELPTPSRNCIRGHLKESVITFYAHTYLGLIPGSVDNAEIPRKNLGLSESSVSRRFPEKLDAR